MIKRPLFSIVTVCLNAGDNLLKTAESLKAQNFTNYEYIIKDGLSTDGSLERIPKDERCRVVRMKDSGIFDAMNQSLALARGEYVVFLNAGDLFFDRNVLADVTHIIGRNPEVEFFYGDIQKKTSKKGFDIYPKKLSRYFVYTSNICHQAWFVSKPLYDRLGGFDMSHTLGGDYLFLLKALVEEEAKAAHVRRIVAIYKGGGISSDPVLARQSELLRKVARSRYFKKSELIVYSTIFWIRNLLKVLFYDKYLYHIWRWWYSFRFSEAGRKSKSSNQ